MTDFIRHITGPQDRWDSLAYEFYGDAMRYAPLVSANPALGKPPILPPGIEVLVPILDEAIQSTAILPPWRL